MISDECTNSFRPSINAIYFDGIALAENSTGTVSKIFRFALMVGADAFYHLKEDGIDQELKYIFLRE
jgi:hypothetical protein